MDRTCYSEMAMLEDRHWWFVARRRILQTVLDRLSLDPSAAVLEIGCGTGGNLALLASYGRLYACEPDAECRTLAAAQGLAEVAQGHLPDAIPFDGQKFDLIAVLDVLEHVEADEASLAAMFDRLKPGGMLLLTVPAYRFLWSQHDVVYHHVRRYVRRDMVAKLQAARFQILHTTYFNTVLFPVVAAVRMAGKLQRKQGSNLTLPADPVNGLLQGIFASERFIVPHVSLPFGVSLLALAKKCE